MPLRALSSVRIDVVPRLASLALASADGVHHTRRHAAECRFIFGVRKILERFDVRGFRVHLRDRRVRMGAAPSPHLRQDRRRRSVRGWRVVGESSEGRAAQESTKVGILRRGR